MGTFRFAIMGAGNIANRFCDAVKLLDGCEVAAVASKSLDKATAFAQKNNVAHAYGDYREMLEKDKPDCVYISTLPNDHFRLSILCLEHNTPVLCEKAMFMNGSEAHTVFAESEKRGVFVMEAMWSRFLPAVNKARQWVESGAIGKVTHVEVNIGFIPPHDKGNRYHDASLGGGAAHDITVYAYEIATYIMGDNIQKTSVSAIFEDTGSDLTDHVVLHYPDALAVLTATFGARFDDKMTIYGENGKIIVPCPHYTSDAFLFNLRGEETEHFKDTATVNGFTYEIAETVRCIHKGLIESPVVPHTVTTACSELFDMINAQRI